MKNNNNVYEAPKALVLNVSASDVITTSGARVFNAADNDALGWWFSPSDDN